MQARGRASSAGGQAATHQLDLRRARLRGPDLFQRFRVPDRGQPLQNLARAGDTELIVFERQGRKRALLMRQMAYHHVAQGQLAGAPYLISF